MGLLSIKHASLHYNIDILSLIHSFLRGSIPDSKCAFLSNRKKGAARTKTKLSIEDGDKDDHTRKSKRMEISRKCGRNSKYDLLDSLPDLLHITHPTPSHPPTHPPPTAVRITSQ